MSAATTAIAKQIDDGETTGLRFGKTTWRLLEKSNSRVLLLSENLVERAPYNRTPGQSFVSWEESYLRKYMQRDLPIILFTDDEYDCINTTHTDTTTNPIFHTQDNGAIDKLFILSIEEVDKYLGDGNTLKRLREGNVYTNTAFSDVVGDEYSRCRVARLPGKESETDWWWLRTPGEREDTRAEYQRIGMRGWVRHCQCYVGNKGNINMHGSNYDDVYGGIRAAMWLNL